MAKDERVRDAIAHWAPRFIANGVDYNDFLRVTQQLEAWDDWLDGWAACGAQYAQMGEAAEAEGHTLSAGQHYLHAAMAYHFGKFLFVHAPDQLRAAHDQTVHRYRQALPSLDLIGGAASEAVAIPYEGDAVIRGILRKPAHAQRPAVVILIPGLDSVKEELHAYTDDFLRRGMATLAIDGPGQGEMEFSHPMRFDYEVPIRATIDYLESRNDVDASRVGLMGVSLGGYYAPRAAAYEPRVRAVIANCGPYDVAEEFATMPSLTRAAFIARLHVDDATVALEHLRAFTLHGVIAQVKVPFLIIMGRLDRVVSPQSAERMARDAADAHGDATLWMFDNGNHVCNNIPYHHRPQQADWMQARLAV